MSKWNSRTPITAEKLKYMLRKYKELTGEINVEKVVTPTNLDTEKRRWVSAAKVGVFNSPSFTYNERYLREVIEKKPEVEELKKMVMGDTAGLGPDDRTIADLLTNRVEDVLATIKLAESILHRDDATSAKISREKFGVPSSQAVHYANDFVEAMKSKGSDAPKQFLKGGSEPLFTDDEISKLQDLRLNTSIVVKSLEKALHSGEYRGWKVETGPIQVPRVLPRKIIVPEVFHITAFRLAMFVVKNLDCWALREANAEQYLRGIGGSAFKTDDSTLSEGLEAFSSLDFELKAIGKAAQMPAPFQILAINQALRKRSFRTVGEEIITFATTPV
ncbi:hypothetical protein IJH02_03600 [Candidatus Saccharibacteria bacterium]|nr:hypothetical protein [Candidatus Saccharibacteria bacterium]